MNKSPAPKTLEDPLGKLILRALSNHRLPPTQQHIPLIGLYLLKISILNDRKIVTRNVIDIEKWRKNVTEKGLVLNSIGTVKDTDLNSIERRKRPTGRRNIPGTDARKGSSQILKASCIQTKLPSLAGKRISLPFVSLSPVTGDIVQKTESHRLADPMLTFHTTKLLLCTCSLRVPSKSL
jgi:hypothetical protein